VVEEVAQRPSRNHDEDPHQKVGTR
jgi:hypothetical protein